MESCLQTRWIELRRLLNADNIRPYLLSKKLLTLNEYEKLKLLSGQKTQADQVEELLRLVIQKGSQHEQLFLDALKTSVGSDSPHLGHCELITLLETDMKRNSSTLRVYPEPCERDGICFQAQQSPPGSPPLPNKSGLGRLGYQVSASLMSQGFSVNTPAQPLLGSVSSMDIMQTRPKPNLGDFSYVNQARTSWHEREELKCQIVKDSRLIMRKYASLVLNVYRLLQRNQVPFEEVQIALLHLGCFQSRPNSPTLFPESSELYRAKTIPELVCSLHAYTSWFNYDLIKFLACEEKLGGVDGQLLIGEYEAELREFFSKYIFECPQFSVECEVPPGFQEFEMKIDWDYKTCQAHQVALFKTTVSELLDIKPYALQLKSVEEGCVLTTWIVPSSIVACIVERVLDNEEALSKVNVTLVRIAGKCLEMTSKKSLSHVTQRQTAGHNLFKAGSSSVEHRYTRELTIISEGSSTNLSLSALSDLTDPSTPKDRYSFISSSGSASAARNSKISISSLNFYPETVSNEEAEILSLYSGERSPCNTMERSHLGVTYASPLVVDHCAIRDGDQKMKRHSKSMQQLPQIGSHLSPIHRFTSDPNIAKTASTSKQKKKRWFIRKALTPQSRKGSFRNIIKWVNRGRKSPTQKPSQDESPKDPSNVHPATSQIPVLELDSEPIVTTTGSAARLFYFKYMDDNPYSVHLIDESGKISPTDGTSVASLFEWHEPAAGNSSEAMKSPPTGEMSTFQKVEFLEGSQCSTSTSSQDTGIVISYSDGNHSRTSTMSSVTTFASSLSSSHRQSRVSSPTNSSGYYSESRRSSQVSLPRSESMYNTRCQLTPEDAYDVHVVTSTSVKRFHSMNSHSQRTIRNTSPLARARSNSMHK